MTNRKTRDDKKFVYTDPRQIRIVPRSDAEGSERTSDLTGTDQDKPVRRDAPGDSTSTPDSRSNTCD